jgi:hypothetical protein
MRLQSSVPHRGGCMEHNICQHELFTDIFTPVPTEAMPLTCRPLGTMGARYVGLGSHGDETFPEACCNSGVAALLPRSRLRSHSWLEARFSEA